MSGTSDPCRIPGRWPSPPHMQVGGPGLPQCVCAALVFGHRRRCGQRRLGTLACGLLLVCGCGRGLVRKRLARAGGVGTESCLPALGLPPPPPKP